MIDRKIQRCARLLSQYSGQTYMQCLSQIKPEDVLTFPQGQTLPLSVCKDLQRRAWENQVQWFLKNQYSQDATEQEFDWKACAAALGITTERAKLLSAQWTALVLAKRTAIKEGFVENGFGMLQPFLDDTSNNEITFNVGTQVLEVNNKVQTLSLSLSQSVQYISHLLAVHFVAVQSRNDNVMYFYTPDEKWLVYVTHSIAETPWNGGLMMDAAMQTLMEGQLPELFAKTKVEFRRMPSADDKGTPNYILTNALLHAAEAVDVEVLDIDQYNRHRRALRLPDSQEIVQRFGSWDKALDQAELPTVKLMGTEGERRFNDEYLLQSVQKVAKMLDKPVISSHMYDDFRAGNPQMVLPSSSVVRKWIGGGWAGVVRSAGMEPLPSRQRAKPKDENHG